MAAFSTPENRLPSASIRSKVQPAAIPSATDAEDTRKVV